MPIWMKKRRKNWKNARIYEKKLLDKGVYMVQVLLTGLGFGYGDGNFTKEYSFVCS